MMRAPQVSELTSGVDALYLSARAVLSPSLCERLEEMRRFADRVREPARWTRDGARECCGAADSAGR